MGAGPHLMSGTSSRVANCPVAESLFREHPVHPRPRFGGAFPVGTIPRALNCPAAEAPLPPIPDIPFAFWPRFGGAFLSGTSWRVANLSWIADLLLPSGGDLQEGEKGARYRPVLRPFALLYDVSSVPPQGPPDPGALGPGEYPLLPGPLSLCCRSCHHPSCCLRQLRTPPMTSLCL